MHGLPMSFGISHAAINERIEEFQAQTKHYGPQVAMDTNRIGRLLL